MCFKPQADFELIRSNSLLQKKTGSLMFTFKWHVRWYQQATEVRIFCLHKCEKTLHHTFADRRSNDCHWAELINNNSVRCVGFECLNEPPISCRQRLMKDAEVTAVRQYRVRHLMQSSSSCIRCSDHKCKWTHQRHFSRITNEHIYILRFEISVLSITFFCRF